jgi:hypothetical protein
MHCQHILTSPSSHWLFANSFTHTTTLSNPHHQPSKLVPHLMAKSGSITPQSLPSTHPVLYVEQVECVVNKSDQCLLFTTILTMTQFLWFWMTLYLVWKGWKLDMFFFSSHSLTVEQPFLVHLSTGLSMTMSLILIQACGQCSWNVTKKGNPPSKLFPLTPLYVEPIFCQFMALCEFPMTFHTMMPLTVSSLFS